MSAFLGHLLRTVEGAIVGRRGGRRLNETPSAQPAGAGAGAGDGDVVMSVPAQPLGAALDRERRERDAQRKEAAEVLARASMDPQRRRQEAIEEARKAKEEEEQGQGSGQPRPRGAFAKGIDLNMPGVGGAGVGFGSMHDSFKGDGRLRRAPPPEPTGRAAAAAGPMRAGHGEEKGKSQREGAEIVDLDGDEQQEEEGRKPAAAPAAPAPAPAKGAAASGRWRLGVARFFQPQGPPTNEVCLSGRKRRHTDFSHEPGGLCGFVEREYAQDQKEEEDEELQRAIKASLLEPQPGRAPQPYGPVPPPSMASAASPATGSGGGPGGLRKGPRRIPTQTLEDGPAEGPEKKRRREEEGGGEMLPPGPHRPRGPVAGKWSGPERPRPEAESAAVGKESEVIELLDDEPEPKPAGASLLPLPSPPPASAPAPQSLDSPSFCFHKQGGEGEQPAEGKGKGKCKGAHQEQDEDGGDVVEIPSPEPRRTRSGPGNHNAGPAPLDITETAAAATTMATVDLSGASPKAKASSSAVLDVDDEVAILDPDAGARPRRERGWGPAAGAAGKGKEAEPTEEEEITMVNFESSLTFMLEQAAKLSDPLMQAKEQPPAQPLTRAQAQSASVPQRSPPNFFQFTSEDALRDVALRLLKDELLSDEILNRALDLLAHCEQADDCVLFNTFWYEKLRDGRYPDAAQWLKRALRGRDRHRLRLVLAPVNISNAHWVLVFVDLDRGTVQEWDPASAECMLDPSRVKNVQDALERELKDVLVQRHGPGFTGLRRRLPPRGLPQQADAINCGLFVILYAIHLVFLQGAPPADAIAALAQTNAASAGAAGAGAGADDFLIDGSGYPVQRRRSRRIEEAVTNKAQTALDAVPLCCFKHEEGDLFRYRLLLLAWILHSQTSQLPRTEPVLLHHVRLARVGVGDSLKCDSKQDRRKLLLALLRDDAPAGARAELLRAGMQLLALFYKQEGVVAFLPPKWFDLARQGRLGEAEAEMQDVCSEMSVMEQIVAPVLLPGGKGCLLARITLQDELKTVYLHGSNALAHANDAVIPPLLAALKHTFDRYFQVKQVVTSKASQPRMDEVAVLLLAMQAGRRGSACKESAELFQDGGPDLSTDARFFAARVGLLRWFLRHTNWVA